MLFKERKNGKFAGLSFLDWTVNLGPHEQVLGSEARKK